MNCPAGLLILTRCEKGKVSNAARTSGESVWLTRFGKENEVVGQLMHSMSLTAAGARALCRVGSTRAWQSGTCRHYANNNDSGRPTGDRRVNSLAEFIGGRILAGFPANVIRSVSWEPRVAPSFSRLVFWIGF
jgi:hypothetical protein